MQDIGSGKPNFLTLSSRALKLAQLRTEEPIAIGAIKAPCTWYRFVVLVSRYHAAPLAKTKLISAPDRNGNQLMYDCMQLRT